jgi:hypothetical protein
MYLAGVKVGSKEPKPFTARGLGYSLAFFSFHPHQKRPDTLLKIAKRFSSAVVRGTHELLLANPEEPEISPYIWLL